MFKRIDDSLEEQSDLDEPIITKEVVLQSNVELDHLACPICLNVIWSPVTCGSVGCYSSFCEVCITQWLKSSEQVGADEEEQKSHRGCPKCKRPFRHISIPLLKGLLESLVVKCLYHHNGCTERLPYSRLLEHMQECSFKRVRCSGCSQLFLRRHYQEHVGECQQVPVDCPKCTLRLVRSQFLSYHTQENCQARQLTNQCSRVDTLKQDLENLNARFYALQWLTQRLIRGETLPLKLDFHTTFTQHFTFPTVTLIKPSFNPQKQKFDFLHFYIINPLRPNSPMSVAWRMKIHKLIGNLLIGFCSSMCTSSLDYVINKFGELKRKQPNESKYRPIRKVRYSSTQTFLDFGAGDQISFHFNSYTQQLKIENLTRNLSMRLEMKEVQDIGPTVYNFFSMDTLNDSVSFSS